MTQHRPEQPEVSRDPELQEAFDAFLHQTHVPRDFHARVMARVQQRPARHGRWGWLERWWTWWTHHWSPLEVWVVAVCVLLSLAFNLGLGYYTWKQRHVITALGQELTATRAQVYQAQAESHQWPARVAALTDQLAALQEQRRAPQEPLVASVLDQAGVAFNQGRYDDAIALSEAVIPVEPTNSRAYLQAGRAYAAKGRNNEAVAAFNTGLQQNPGSTLRLAIDQELGVVYGKQGRYDEAITVLQEAAQLALHDFHTQYLLGAAYLQKGLQREALAALNEALRLAKASPGGKESVPSIEAMLSYLPPLAPSTPTAPPPRPFKLTVQATPADSTIKFDNSNLEYRPGMELSPGRYALVVSREGYKPARQSVMISTADVTLDVALDMIKYKLTVQVTPIDSTIKFDNSKLEYRPGMELAPGRYGLVVTREGYKPARKQVTISLTDVTLNVALEPDKAPPKTSPAVGVDTRAPSIALKQESIPKNVGPAQSRVIIIGQALDDSGVAEVTVNGKKAELSADGTFAAEVLLKVGENVIHVTALDINGNEGQETFTIYRESTKISASTKPNPAASTAPTIVILSPEGLRVGPREARTTLRGRVTAPDGVAEVTVNGNAVVLESDGTFSVGVTLDVGENPIVVAAMDTQRHPFEQTFTIYRPTSLGAATRRLALIVGNAKYPVNPLRNAVNDASDMHDVLKKLGFDTKLLTDATFEQMEDAIDAFSRELRQGGVGLFYYAGHGVQIDGQNYLIPVDAPLQSAAKVKNKSVHAHGLLERMADAGNELNIIILDACRENVLMREARSVQRGLAVMYAAQGSLIAYATAPGDVALDGSERERNGVYTKYLLRYITQKGLAVEDLFKRVRMGVKEATQGKQIPWEASSLAADFYFAGK
jgi:tetratricopeptide (TPR) repeat protein